MPITASAQRRMRNSARRQTQNKSIKSRLKTLERSYQTAVTSGNKEAASAALTTVHSALDKAAKKGVIPRSTASRKKSRLALRLAKAK